MEAGSIPGRGAPRGHRINSMVLRGIKGHRDKSLRSGEAKAQGETQEDGHTLGGLDKTQSSDMTRGNQASVFQRTWARLENHSLRGSSLYLHLHKLPQGSQHLFRFHHCLFCFHHPLLGRCY